MDLMYLQPLQAGYTRLSIVPPTRYMPHSYDPPSMPPAYSSLLDDAVMQSNFAKYTERQHHQALYPAAYKAGQNQPSNGAFGRDSTPRFAPEVLSGALVSTSI